MSAEKTIFKTFVHSLYILLFCIFIGSVLITLANYFPLNKANVSSSLEQLEEEDWFPDIPTTSNESSGFHSMKPTTLELATDNLILKMAAYDGENAGLEQAFRAFSTHYGEEYSRYWHGYVVVLRVLLFFFDYYKLRLLNGVFQVTIIFLIIGYIKKIRGNKYALALASSYFLLMPQALAYCFQYSSAFYATFISLLVYLVKKEFWDRQENHVYFFVIVGAVTNFLDLLTFPLSSWGILIVWILLLSDKQETQFRHILHVVFSGLAWILGYAGMWIGKWCEGSLVLKENLFEKAISEAFLWVGNDGRGITIYDRYQAMLVNWKTYAYQLYVCLFILWVGYILGKGILGGFLRDRRIPALLLVASSSFVWYFLLASHSLMHHVFTHRTFSCSIAAFFAIALLATDGKQDFKGQKHILHSIPIVIFSMLAIILALQVKDDYQVHNGVDQFEARKIEKNVSMTFIPSFSHVREFSVGVFSNNCSEGSIRVILRKGTDTVSQLDIPITEFLNVNLAQIPITWKLRAREEYTLVIEPEQTDGDIYILSDITRGSLLNELGNSMIDDVDEQGQILAQITYYCRPVGMTKICFWIITFFMIFFMILMTIHSSYGYESEALKD